MASRRVWLAAGGAAASASLAFTSSRRADSENAKIGHRVTLTSVAENFRTETWAARGENWAVTKRTLHGGRQEGVDEIEVQSGPLTFTVLPTRGMSIGRVSIGGTPLGWQSPVREAVHPRAVDLQDFSGLGWLTGFNEWLVRCGVSFAGHPGVDDGRLLTLHGRIGNIPASEVEVIVDEAPPHRIRVRGRVDEAMFKFCDFELWTEVSTIPGSLELTISDVLKNKSSYPKEYEMIYHTNFGAPLLQQGTRFVIGPNAAVTPFNADAAAELADWKTYKGPTKGYGETVYCVTPKADAHGFGRVALVDAAGTCGVGLRYTAGTLPVFNLWKNTDLDDCHGYVTGLEPGTNFAYNRAKERAAGRVRQLGPLEEVSFGLAFTFLRGAEEVRAAMEEVARCG